MGAAGPLPTVTAGVDPGKGEDVGPNDAVHHMGGREGWLEGWWPKLSVAHP